MDRTTGAKPKIQPSMYRVYKSTVQRVPVNIKSLSSHAAFLITLDGEKQVIAWVGSDCESTDSELVKELGLGVLTKDYRLKDISEVPLILEGSEPAPLLDAVLEIFWSNSNTYFSKITSSERKQKITNNSVSVGLIEKMSFGSDYDFQETAFAHPDARGTVPRVTFVPIEMKTVAYVNVGEQWDIWISRGVLEEEEANVMQFVENAIASQISLGSTAFKKEVLSQYIQVVRQGEERFLFRRPLKIFTDFEPPGKTAPRAEAKRTKSERRDPSARFSSGVGFVFDDMEEKKERDSGAFAAVSKPTPIEVGGGAGGLKKQPSMKISFKDDAVVVVEDDPLATSPKAGEHKYVDFYSVHAHTHSRGHHHDPNMTIEDMAAGKLAAGEQDEEDTMFDDFGNVVPTKKMGGGPPPVTRAPDGTVKVTADLLHIVDEQNLSPEDRTKVIAAAINEPGTLVGYQVEIDEGIFAGVFVITKTKKTLFHKTMYYLAATDGDEFWIRLQRGSLKKGQKFRPLRKVF